ncbi:MAG: DNA polymerase III subunit alpha [Candidatus Brennerbacteria bacterium]|nr:DNA polymerase III subunit alpha [Candidatus Brennerbacteria bacterium]
MSKFTHLHVHSHYSLLDGLTKIDDLVARAKELGMHAIALTDHGNLYGAVEFFKAARAAGVKPILGVEVYVAPHGRLSKRPRMDETRYHLTLLAKNETGWKNLIALVTQSYLEGFYYKPRVDRELLAARAAGLVCLSGCVSSELARHLSAKRFVDAEETAAWHKKVFGDDYYLEIQPHDPSLWESTAALGKKLVIPLVATADAHYLTKDDKTAHEILLAVQTNAKLDDEDRLSLKDYDVSLTSPEKMAEIFRDYPAAVTNTLRIADACTVELELGKTKLPKFPFPPEFTSSFDYLKALVEERLSRRYAEIGPEIRDRIEMELAVIEKTGFADYFLIVADFVNWAKTHGIVVGPGRGSAAGSIISYIVGITNVEPLRYRLLFERFLNPDRIQVPDIDIDFTDTRRDEVVAYVREKYGADKVAQIITFGTMMARAAIRDTARAMGLPYGTGDRLAKLIPFNATIGEALEIVPELKTAYAEETETKRLLDAAVKLEGVARHASVHACGVVISSEALTNFVPLQRAPQGENTVITQFEMHSIEDLGLLKMDFLGLKNLTIIERTLRLVKELHGEEVNLDMIPLDDTRTFEVLRRGETTGIFQLEGSGMTRYLKDLKPTELEDVIAMIALYRPGPMELIPHFIHRKHGREQITYLHPRLEPILKNTYGVGVYQEQMMQIARDLAGFTLAEADTLRKAIGKKIKSLLDEQKEKLVNGMIANGIDPKTAHAIWELFPPFARYGFNRSHAACYAVVSYQTAYLKAHYPVEFMVALLDTSSGDLDRITFLVGEAKRLQIPVLPPDVNMSAQNFTVDEEARGIRFGLLAIKNLGANIVAAVIDERTRGGPYESLSQFLTRVQHRDMNKKSLESLIKSGAFDSLGMERGQALDNIEDLVRFNQTAKRLASSNQSSLFGSTASFASFRMRPGKSADKGLMLTWEKELLGLYLTDHPWNAYLAKLGSAVKPIKETVQAHPEDRSRNRERNGNGARLRLAGIIAGVQRITTKKGQPMLFVTLEDLSDNLEVMVFADTLAKHPLIWQENRAVLLTGRLSWRDGEPKLICDEVKELQA